MKRAERTKEIQAFIIESLEEKNYNIAGEVAKKFNISRQASNRHFKKMVAAGILVGEGTTRNKKYWPKPFISEKYEFDLNDDFLKDQYYGTYDENKVWMQLIAPLLKNIPKNIYTICQYGFAEMLNNVFDHSNATKVTMSLEHNAAAVKLMIMDNGMGIFNKIQQECNLEDKRLAMLELAKGKFTTDPNRHTGEGIFFSSRMFDTFIIESENLRYIHYKAGEDWLVEKAPIISEGTMIYMRINPNSKRTTKEIFDKFASDLEDYGFTKTKVPVALAKYGDENLISRSQAKRLLARFDRFKEVILDFDKVESIGPAFADEIFRVFVNEHPDVKLTFINANDNVTKMIIKAKKYR